MAPTHPRSLITGASAGIGMAFARALAGRGHHLVLVARRLERLQVLTAELQQRHDIEAVALECDLAPPQAVQQLCDTLQQRNLPIDWLINNAGYGVPGSLVSSPWQTHEDFIRVLMTAPTQLCWRLLPGMRERGYGRIINVASLAGHVPGTAGHTLYGASKAYLIKVSQSLALENRDRGIHVCALCPGFTRSEFHDVTGTRAKVSSMPDFMWQDADAVVADGIKAVERGDVVHVTGGVNRAIKAVMSLLPDRLALRLSARSASRYRNTHD